ncbi:MAG TPA: ABC transporter substrate-binding protein [Vineibacter sp.]|nr:ABC transporter substrate-binding protein [Vineibacter sp.]
MRRRALLVTIPALAAAPTALAQSPGRVLRVGWLTQVINSYVDWFLRGMRELGYREDQTFVLLRRDADGREDRLGAMASELAREGAGIIVAVGGSAAREAAIATTLPIVAILGDPTSYRVGASVARPAGRVTGVATGGADYAGKWLELIHEMAPATDRIGVLRDTRPITTHEIQLAALNRAAPVLRKTLTMFAAGDPADIEAAFAAMRRDGIGAAIVISSSVFHGLKRQVVDAAMRNRLVCVHEHRDFTEAGGLASYGPDFRVLFARMAYFVDRIAKGATPGDLPFELPSRFELVLNLRTARVLGVTLPPALLARADEVIE